MRVYALYIVVVGLAVYARKDWFKSLCGLILLMAVIGHEDMPTNIMGIQGLNPWNGLLLCIVVAWLVQRRREGLAWDMPRHVSILLLIYLVVVLVGWARMMADPANMVGYTMKDMISEELINTVKWVIPGLMLFDGCRSRRRVAMVVVCILVMYFLLACQIVSRMPFSSALGGAGERIQRIRLKTCSSVGYSAVDMSVILGGASWAIVAIWSWCRHRWQKALTLGAAAAAFCGQALTGGRAGYVAWGITGLAMCLIRWRKGLLLAPLVPIGLYLVFPGAAQRLMSGFGEEDPSGASTVNYYQVTSGRSRIWPHVTDKIAQAPMLGYGRRAMVRTGLRDFLGRQYGKSEAFPHPHNVYLEWLLDNGLIGFLPILAFYAILIVYSARLFQDARDPLCVAVGGMAFALVFIQLVAGMTSQHFYPREGTFAMWVSVFLMLRVYVVRSQSRMPRLAPAQVGHTALGAAGRPRAAYRA